MTGGRSLFVATVACCSSSSWAPIVGAHGMRRTAIHTSVRLTYLQFGTKLRSLTKERMEQPSDLDTALHDRAREAGGVRKVDVQSRAIAAAIAPNPVSRAYALVALAGALRAEGDSEIAL